MNNSIEWKPRSVNQLAEILLNDFLVVDVAKPFSKNTYFDIEYSLLNGGTYKTCGGRVPNDDIINLLMTMLINGGKSPMITDGVDQPTKWATESFPYLASPNSGLIPSIRSFISRAIAKLGASKTLVHFAIMDLLAGLLIVIGVVLILYFLIREGISRLFKGNYSKKKHPHLILSVAILFGLACILGWVSHAFTFAANAVFTLISIISFYLYFKWKKREA